ncbi:MAG: hypothetical protein IT289_01195 [Oligoflexia bacterium]|nr:hypothetical protein [Oligoflexia bacterium]
MMGIVQAVLLAGVLIFTELVWADAYNKWVFPFGDKSALLSNTGIGDETSMGSVFFNPGALAKNQGSKLSLSGSLYFVYNIKFDGLSYIDNTLIPYEATGFNTIPSTAVSTFKVFNHQLAFSILIPSSTQIESSGVFTTPNSNGAIVPKVSEREMWIGLTTAHMWGEKLGVGVSIYGVQYSKSNVSGTIVKFNSISNTVFSTVSKVTPTVYGLVTVVGAHYDLSSDLKIGLRGQAPFLQVAGSAEVYRISPVTLLGSVTVTTEDKQSTPAKYDIPWDLGVGITYRLNENYKILFDASIGGALDYKELPQVPNISEEVYTQNATRYSIGVERRMTDTISGFFGYALMPSSIGDQTLRQAGRVKNNTWMTTLGANWKDDNISTGLGGMYFEGYGTSIVGSTGSKVGAKISGYGLLLATNYIF